MSTEPISAGAAVRSEQPVRAADTIVDDHIAAVLPVVAALRDQGARLAAWGEHLAERLLDGGRLLAAGNGGSAAEAQHLTAELVGRFDGDRRAFSAICLHGDTSSVTAIANDYGWDEVFARQVTAHAAPGDVLVLLSTSGASRNLVRAAQAARAAGATTWAMTGPGPNPLTEACDDALILPGVGANVQEAQLVAVHALCRVFDARVVAAHGREAVR
ncbi:SIS domain-containing protein [uncultured Amnibacterium sp.]|uniref:D-sedoheptulose-7-phosphate isomerase n=1 Tax=uncultured Amnibacterium sp. TaxID=1631851 RepID=UPI0035CC0765